MTHGRSDVLIDARLLAYRRGGISRYVEELCRWLPRVAPDLQLTCFANRRNPYVSARGIRVFTPPHFRFERTALGAELMARAPRLVHSPDFIAPATVGVKRVITVHDLWFLTHPEHLSPDSVRYYRQVERSVEVADRIIAVSHHTAAQVVDGTGVDPQKLVVIWNGVDQSKPLPSREQARDALRSRLDEKTAARILNDRPVILCVGTIEPRKRQSLLLEAMSRFSQNGSNIMPLLLYAGQPGWSCDEIVAGIRKASISGDVVWLDSVDDDLLAALYGVATVLAVPSLDEGFGLPVLEAMRARLPVVAAKRGALPEIAGDAALLIDDDDPETWASALATIVADTALREKMSERGVSRAESFSWERTALQTADVYREVLKR